MKFIIKFIICLIATTIAAAAAITVFQFLTAHPEIAFHIIIIFWSVIGLFALFMAIWNFMDL
jgi:hypothetical protein